MIKIGTDCSGIEAPIEALKNICNKYDLSFEHEFSSEICEYATEYIKNNHNPKILFNNMTKRKSKDIPYVDIYVSGFPCQPYSRANKYKTPVDSRLNLFEDCIRVIKTVNPKFFILENVKTLVTLNNGSYFNDILNYTMIYRTIPLILIVPFGVSIGTKLFTGSSKENYKKYVLYFLILVSIFGFIRALI